MTDLVIDANSAWARAFYAANAETSDLRGMSYKGYPISATIATLKTVFSLIDREGRHLWSTSTVNPPDRILFCWDGTAKKDKDRKPKPDGYHEERKRFIKITKKLLGAAHAELEVGEADDAVCTAALRSEAAGNHVIIASGDKDLQQIVGGNVCYYSFNTKGILTKSSILDKWKVKRPIQVAVALAILGDSVDKVKGVPNYGPKKVEALFQRVTEDMNLEQCVECVKSQLPVNLHPDFEQSLDLTLLYDDVKGIPEPSEIKLADGELLEDYGLNYLAGDYFKIYRQFNGITDDDIIDDLD